MGERVAPAYLINVFVQLFYIGGVIGVGFEARAGDIDRICIPAITLNLLYAVSFAVNAHWLKKTVLPEVQPDGRPGQPDDHQPPRRPSLRQEFGALLPGMIAVAAEPVPTENREPLASRYLWSIAGAELIIWGITIALSHSVPSKYTRDLCKFIGGLLSYLVLLGIPLFVIKGQKFRGEPDLCSLLSCGAHVRAEDVRLSAKDYYFKHTNAAMNDSQCFDAASMILALVSFVCSRPHESMGGLIAVFFNIVSCGFAFALVVSAYGNARVSDDPTTRRQIVAHGSP